MLICVDTQHIHIDNTPKYMTHTEDIYTHRYFELHIHIQTDIYTHIYRYLEQVTIYYKHYITSTHYNKYTIH